MPSQKKLVEESGLAERTFAEPVAVILVAAEFAAYPVARHLRGEPGILLLTIVVGIIIWSAVACIRTLLVAGRVVTCPGVPAGA